jgi:hypothetical protein
MKHDSIKLKELFKDLVFYRNETGTIVSVKKLSKSIETPLNNLGLNDLEQAAYDAFYSKHKHGSIILKIMTDSGIGPSSEVICNHCKKTKDITDYSCW